MTFNDLEQIFVDGCYRSILTNREDLPEKAHRRAGLKAVVEALRDEICNGYAENSARDLANQFNEILASDGSTAPSAQELPAIGGTSGTAPAAAPVCEWTDLGPEWSSSCKVLFGAFASTKGRFFCPSCGKPIKFKEGSE
jgi:hypothetical protein